MSDILSDKAIYSMCGRLADVLRERNIKLATTESCSGGWVAKACTDLPGSSAWFEAAFVTYGNTAKKTILGIDELLLQKHGTVSRAVVAEMLKQSLLKIPASDIVIAISGIAGPDGGSRDKPVGTVWIGWCLRNHLPRIQCFKFEGDREIIRRATVAEAIQGALRLLEEN